MKYTKRVVAAVKKTIQQYEDLIRDTQLIYNWQDYGKASTCRICNSAPTCSECPLNSKRDVCTGEGTFYHSMEHITNCNASDDMIREIAQARLNWIKKTVKKKGVKL